MKKITLLFFSLLITVVGFSQTEILNVAFDTALPTELRNNTDPTFISETSLTWSGTSGNPSGSMSASGVVDEANGTAVGRAFQFLYEDAAFDFGSSGSLSISFDIKIDAAIVNANLQFQTQVSKVGGGVVVVNNENIQNSVPFGEWTNLQFDMTPVPSEFDTNGNLLIFFWNLASAPIGGSGGAFEVDNIVITASDPPDPTCDDGVQNGNETGVDCGGPDCPECISDPTVSADVPIQDPTGVLSVYSETYAGGRVAAPLASVTNFNFLAFNGSGSYTEVDIESNGNLTGKIVDLSFYGAQWDAVDVSSYTYVHIDYYATTSTNFNFYLIDATAGIPGGSGEEPRYRFGGGTPDAPLVTGAWTSVFIPLSAFTNWPSPSYSYDLNDIFQWKFDGNGSLFFDNIYFTSSTLDDREFAVSDFNISPNPSNNVWNIKAQQTIESVQLFDVLGKQVMTVKPNNSDFELDASTLPKGLYFARMTSAVGSNSVKLIKN